jgi:Fe-S-cluster containining protein
MISMLRYSHKNTAKSRIESLVESVTELYEYADQKVNVFKKLSGLKCYPGCSRCCVAKKIDVSILEMLPLANHLFQSKQIEVWQEKLSSIKDRENKKCLLHSPKAINSQLGHCIFYAYRPLICRLFGFSYVVDKYGNKVFYSCPIIKSKMGNQYENIVNKIQFRYRIPVTMNYYFRLGGIDLQLTKEYYPLNIAIQHAIDVLLNSRMNMYGYSVE